MAVTINGSAGVTTNSGAVYDSIQSGTSVTASGTSVDFTSIPSWVKRITVMFSGVSTNGASSVQIQIGDSGGIETTGYLGASSIIQSAVSTANSTTGVLLNFGTQTTATNRNGNVVFSQLSGNTWTAFGTMSLDSSNVTSVTASSKVLSDVLTQIRITTVNGTDTFDAGSINILYE